MTDLKIEMYDSFPESTAKLNQEATAIRLGIQALLKRNPLIRDSLKAELRIYVDHSITAIRHDLSLLVQQNESAKNTSRDMDFSGLREQNGFDAVDSQLAELSGSKGKK